MIFGRIYTPKYPFWMFVRRRKGGVCVFPEQLFISLGDNDVMSVSNLIEYRVLPQENGRWSDENKPIDFMFQEVILT